MYAYLNDEYSNDVYIMEVLRLGYFDCYKVEQR